MMGVGPSQDLFYREPRQVPRVAASAAFGEKLSQRRPGPHAADADAQGAVHGPPRLLRRLGDGARLRSGPGAGALMVSVGPEQDLFTTQHGQRAGITHVPLLGEE